MQLVVILLFAGLVCTAQGTPIFCHFYFWATYRIDEGHFEVSDIDPNLCTHLLYSHYFIDDSTFSIKPSDHWGDFERNGKGTFNEFKALKNDNPNLKVMLSVGGWAQNPVTFSRMASSSKSRKAFIDSVMNFIDLHNLDGVDISWRHPNDRGGNYKDKENFVNLLKELHSRLERDNLLLTADLYLTPEIMRKSYNLKDISDNVDFIFGRMHHYSHPWTYKTGPSSPIYEMETAINHLLDSGVPSEKIAMGFFTLGTIFVLKEPLDPSASPSSLIGLPTEHEHPVAAWSNAVGETGFNEVCWNQTHSDGWIIKWDPASKTPFTFKNNILISYDNELSFRKKCELLLNKKLGAAVVWTIDQDDFKGLCNNGPFPLISEIKRVLPKGSDVIRYKVVNEEFVTF